MLDVARRFMSLAALLRVVDAMAFYKLNVLHLHLSDDQGFRLQSDAYPELASGESYGGSELRELVARGGGPGHSGGAGTRYARPCYELARRLSGVESTPGRSRRGRNAANHENDQAANVAKFPHPVATSKRFGPHQAVLNVADEAVYEVIDNLFGELAEIFPDPYVHMGGDEVLPDWWLGEPRSRCLHAAPRAGDAVALQAHFNTKVAALAAAMASG